MINNEKKAFTLIEALIVIIILALLLTVAYRLLVTSQKGAIHGQEASLHLMAGDILAVALERDFCNVLPFKINSDKGKVAGPISFSPDNVAADSVLFWALSDTGVKQIRYSFDRQKRFVLREEVDSTGQAIRSERFAEGYVTDFVINDESKIAETIKVKVEMEGKSKKTVINRVFCHGLINEKDCKHWIFHF
ncbi:MAG: prepilin-type N-terminal cleavage/methylation domain-containing protein [Candidatus Riflebacteria bacterium]|jgi:prepilin-type N-terminal cleavage/methylation domain-containing protein|nr:prepilin-type N-terminal cleavage/methylation domain-containing protein [Candidatus Riflebacteria bacterium]